MNDYVLYGGLAAVLILVLTLALTKSSRLRWILAAVLGALAVAATLLLRQKRVGRTAGVETAHLVSRHEVLAQDADKMKAEIKKELQEESADAIKNAFHKAFRSGP